MLRDEWYNPEKTPASQYFKHSEECINKWIELDNMSGGPLSGKVGSTLTGIPDAEEFAQWKEWASLALVDDDGEATYTNNGDQTGGGDPELVVNRDSAI